MRLARPLSLVALVVAGSLGTAFARPVPAAPTAPACRWVCDEVGACRWVCD